MSLRRPAAVLACTVAFAAAAPLSARAATTIEFGITSLTAFSLPHYVADAKKFYDPEGLTVEMIIGGAATGVIRQLSGGSLNVAQAATNQTLRAIMSGAPIRIISGAAANAPFRLMVAKTVRTWSDLKGATLSVGGATDVTLYFLRVMARKNGLSDGDYDVIYGGGSPDRFAQLLSGAVVGAMLTNPLDSTARQHGYVELGSVPHYLPHWAQNNILVYTRWAQQNHGAVVAFLRVHIRATDYLYDPANRDEVIRILAKYTNSTLETATDAYEFFVHEEVIAPKGALFEAGIQANLDALVETGELTSSPPLENFIDPAFLAEATSTTHP